MLWLLIPDERASIRIVCLLCPIFSNIIIINLLPLPIVILFHLQASQQIALSLKLEHEFTYLAHVVEPQKGTGLLEWVRFKTLGLILQDAWDRVCAFSFAKPWNTLDILYGTVCHVYWKGLLSESTMRKLFLEANFLLPSLWSWTRIKLLSTWK